MQKKIFIIEEDLAVASGLVAFLSLLGFETDLINDFNTEEEVINRVKFFNPDFIVLEPNARLVDGFSILYNLKSDVDTVHKPIFVFTAGDRNVLENRIKNMGAEYYFHKNDHSLSGFTSKLKNIITNIVNKKL